MLQLVSSSPRQIEAQRVAFVFDDHVGALHRRLSKDYEVDPRRSEAMIYIASIDLMLKRLTA